jgi:hypothetical protein
MKKVRAGRDLRRRERRDAGPAITTQVARSQRAFAKVEAGLAKKRAIKKEIEGLLRVWIGERPLARHQVCALAGFR